ncbi:MAG: ATPase, T2SS/T4P/T4SS family [Polyangiales bacterium]
MVTRAPGPDTELLRLREASHTDDALERTRALRELLRMDWRRARESLMAALVDAPWGDRALVVRTLAGRGDPVAKEALPHAEAAARTAPDAPELQARAAAEVALLALRHDQLAHARALGAQALAAAPDGPSLARARALHALAAAALRARDTRAALDALRDVADRYRALGEAGYEARALDSVGSAHAALFQLADAERSYRESLALKEACGDLAGQAITLGGLGRLALQRDDLDAAADFFARDLALSKQLGDDEGLAVMANQLAEVWLRQALALHGRGDEAGARALLAKARRSVEDGVEPARRGGSLRDEGFTLLMRGRLELAEGRHDEAERALARAREAFEVARERPAACAVDLLRAEAARRRGDLAGARASAEAAVRAFEELGAVDGQVRGWMELAMVFLRARDEGARRAAMGRATALAAELPRSATTRQLDAMRAAAEVARLLVSTKRATEAQAAAAVEASLSGASPLGAALLRAGLFDREGFGRFLRETLEIEAVPSEALDRAPDDAALAALPRAAAERLGVLPLTLAAGALRVAMADPLDFGARDQLALLTGLAVAPVYASDEPRLARAIHRAYGRWLALDRRPDAEAALRDLLAHAAARGATDLHLDPGRDELSVRMRVDGVAHEIDRVAREPGAALGRALLARVGLDPMASSAPRVGSGRDAVAGPGGSPLELRVATYPSAHGERVRVSLTPPARAPELDALGLDALDLDALRRAVSRSDGVVLVVGPRGAGKTTTLHALLGAVDLGARTAATLEDAVVYEREGAMQTRFVVGGALDQGAALTALARLDDDVLLVDELADGRAARAAWRLAGEGRLVMVALDADDEDAALASLTEMGVPGGRLRAVTHLLVAQRLVRKLCVRCRVPDRGRIDAAWLRRLSPHEDLAARVAGASLFTHATSGCDACGHLGYQGRALVCGLRDLTREGDAGPSLAARALDAALAGVTSRQELARVLG